MKSGAARRPRNRRPSKKRTRSRRRLIAITAGEPAGIGPDLCLAAARRALPVSFVVIGDRALLEARARALRLAVRCVEFPGRDSLVPRRGQIPVLHVPLARPAIAGRPDPTNSAAVLRSLETAADGCMAGTFDAMVTAPVHKAVINDAGFAFTGHTEFLAQRTGVERVVMMLVGGGMRVALATTHLALKDVAASISREGLEAVLRILRRDLVDRFAIPNPRVLVAGLNPHAGEAGHLGREEIDVIVPVLDKLRSEGYDLVGPVPADTLFQPQRLKACDCVLAMYHDQGLPVLKYASFGGGVNVTLGLPIIRTSVDHGTALELAATGRADPGSLLAAVRLAAMLTARARATPAA